MNAKISLIAAISKNRVLGKNNDLIWKIPEDLKRFRELTENHAVIMGRKTFESIGRALPRRANIIITRDPNFKAADCVIVHSLDQAIAAAQGQNPDNEIFVIGGGQIFNEAIKIADKLYLTIINQEAEGDVYFPEYPGFKVVKKGEDKLFQGIHYWHEDLEKM